MISTPFEGGKVRGKIGELICELMKEFNKKIDVKKRNLTKMESGQSLRQFLLPLFSLNGTEATLLTSTPLTEKVPHFCIHCTDFLCLPLSVVTHQRPAKSHDVKCE